ncbi:MAG TPA: NHL repeat-containing protein, partial [bacterium]|nr:NHL repeat-containing protein [bacterium]
MKRFTLLIGSLLLAGPTPTVADSFSSRPYLEAEGVDVLNRTVSRQWVDRDLLSHPYDTAVLGHVDVYDRFPYVESRWFQVVSDAHWNRLLIGEIGGDLRAHDGAGTPLGALDAPRGVAVDEYGTLYVADSGNHRVMVYDSWTEFGAIELTPRTAIEGFGRPYDVAVSDGGTPFVPGDDRLYVADTGTNRVVAYAIGNDRFELRAEIGELGSGPGRFAGPFAIAVGRSDGVHTRDVYVADAHNGRIVHLVDRGDRFEWTADSRHEAGLVTSLDTDHWGHVYAAAPASGTLVKLTPDLKPLARVETGLERPRAFHVPFARRTDHRTGEVSRAGQGAGVLVEDWTDATGLRVLRLDTDVTHL